MSGKQTPLRKRRFSKLKLKYRQFLYKTSSLYVLSDSYISKNMLKLYC